MNPKWKIVNVRIRIMSAEGILGYASCGLDLGNGNGERGDLFLNNIGIRRDDMDGKLFLSYPKTESRGGKSFTVWQPDSPELRLAIEDAVLGMFANLVGGR